MPTPLAIPAIVTVTGRPSGPGKSSAVVASFEPLVRRHHGRRDGLEAGARLGELRHQQGKTCRDLVDGQTHADNAGRQRERSLRGRVHESR